MSIGAYARASLVVMVALVSNAFAGSESDFDSVFPDGTILPSALVLPAAEPYQADTQTATRAVAPKPVASKVVAPKANLPKTATKASPRPAQSMSPAQSVTGAKATTKAAATRSSNQTAAQRPSAQRAIRTLTVRSTGYNSLSAQTDRTPHVTATGARTRFGIIAVSRDLLRTIPYGSRVRLEDMGSWSGGGRGKYDAMLSEMVFVVEDTMHPRKSGTIDVWFPARRQAIQWGVRRLKVTVLQLGR